jgi:NADH-quinone oxidoreductase subunit L
MLMHHPILFILFLPLVGALIAGILGSKLPRCVSHIITIGCVGAAAVLSVQVAFLVFQSSPEAVLAALGGVATPVASYTGQAPQGASVIQVLYPWLEMGRWQFDIAFMIDRLTVFMMCIVTGISTLIHIYSIGYMAEEPQDSRFFSYISGFTFAMLCLVMSNNFLLLFFGWEGVGLVSYLLIGYWFSKDSATTASLKAFLVNRVGDLGFLLGIAAIFYQFGSLNYVDVFAQVSSVAVSGSVYEVFGHSVPMITLICVLLFIGACGKSAQIPLHVWLEGSMEGPTPISALIHAATMVTAGIFMIARLSPLFEYSDVALSIILMTGAVTSLSMGLLGIVQNDIKRVVAYSTLSQLGYMIAAQGASAYTIGIFHVGTHAFFKALLFLGAGSVILGMHHEQDIRKMGGLYKKMPITYMVMLIGSLALAAIPPFSGFFSKDLIIQAVSHAKVPGASIAGVLVTIGAFLTALYSFRMFFLVFHGKPRMSEEDYHHVHESSFSVLLPLVCLAIPSVVMGWLWFEPMLQGFFKEGVVVLSHHQALDMAHLAEHGVSDFMHHALTSLPYLLSVAGIILAAVAYLFIPRIPEVLSRWFYPLHQLMLNKYYIDHLYNLVFVQGSLALGKLFWRVGDVFLIDGLCVNGTGRSFKRLGQWLRKGQTGYLYHYSFFMIVAVMLFLVWSPWWGRGLLHSIHFVY